MLVADTFLGTIDDPDVQNRLEAAATLAMTLDETERRRSRVRTTADDGTPVGVVVGRELRDGDVLDAHGTLVVVSLADVPAMVVDFGDVAESNGDATTEILQALRLGHAVGNRHWDLAVDGSRAYLPLPEDRERMETEIRPHLPSGATITCEAVSPALFDEGRGTVDHEHSHSHDHHGRHAHGKDAHGVSERHGHHDDGLSPIRGRGDADPADGDES
jgi:urease accessory protein